MVLISHSADFVFFFLILSAFQKQEQLKALKDNKLSQADFHAQQIKEHEEALKRHQDSLKNIQK